MQTRLQLAEHNYTLRRLPKQHNETLQAWDAADEYLLQTLQELPPPNTPPLILNDSFGALALGLHRLKPCALSDSWLSQQATRMNLRENQLPEDSVQLMSSMDTPPYSADQPCECLLIKVPKTMALLEDQLLRLRPLLNEHSTIIVAGMIKSLPASVWKLLERIIGPTTTSLAQKKARLIYASLDPALTPGPSPYPSCYTLEDTDYRICNHANVFSRESLDIGTRFFIQHLPELEQACDIIDLGCGNGVVGLLAAEKMPHAKIHFVDESYMAVASARQNFNQAFGERRQARFTCSDALSEFAHNSADLILCNPPFHQQNVVGDHIARRMFFQSQKVLRNQGELWVIGNRHLGYHKVLRKHFRQVERVASNKKFVILRARKELDT